MKQRHVQYEVLSQENSTNNTKPNKKTTFETKKIKTQVEVKKDIKPVKVILPPPHEIIYIGMGQHNGKQIAWVKWDGKEKMISPKNANYKLYKLTKDSLRFEFEGFVYKLKKK